MKYYENLLQRKQRSPRSRVTFVLHEFDVRDYEIRTDYTLLLRNPKPIGKRLVRHIVSCRSLSMMTVGRR